MTGCWRLEPGHWLCGPGTLTSSEDGTQKVTLSVEDLETRGTCALGVTRCHPAEMVLLSNTGMNRMLTKGFPSGPPAFQQPWPP